MVWNTVIAAAQMRHLAGLAHGSLGALWFAPTALRLAHLDRVVGLSRFLIRGGHANFVPTGPSSGRRQDQENRRATGRKPVLMYELTRVWRRLGVAAPDSGTLSATDTLMTQSPRARSLVHSAAIAGGKTSLRDTSKLFSPSLILRVPDPASATPASQPTPSQHREGDTATGQVREVC